MKVIELLPKLKANRYTYYNLDKECIESFKKLYNYLKKHKNKGIYTSCMREFNEHLKKYDLDYLKKYRAMEVLSQNINHLSF